jgi:hypothetical protein
MTRQSIIGGGKHLRFVVDDRLILQCMRSARRGHGNDGDLYIFVIPAKAGIQPSINIAVVHVVWVPTFVGMTEWLI